MVHLYVGNRQMFWYLGYHPSLNIAIFFIVISIVVHIGLKMNSYLLIKVDIFRNRSS